MTQVLPQYIYLAGAILALLLKGKFRSISNISVALSAFASLVFFTEPQVSHVYNFFGQSVILFNADKTSLFMGYIFSFMVILVSIYSMHVKEKIYHVLSMLFITGAMGMIFAGDLISFYLFGEIMMIVATILICYKKEKTALKAGLRYFVIHLVGSSFLLAGILTNFTQTGSISISSISQGVPAFLILAGIGVNAAFIPFHSWLPDAYSKAPFESSLLLSIFTTKAAVYALARIFPGVAAVAYMGAAMALFGVIMALLQSDARKLLSYHVISQVGFMVAGVGLGTFLGIDGALYHAFNNILYKTLLFMCIGAVIYRTGKQNLAELGGFARNMPITTIACIIAALAISGVPLFNGYASKAILYEASYKSEILLWSLKLASLGTFVSFSKFTYYGFLRPTVTNVREAPLNMSIPMVVLSILCIASGIYPKLTTDLLPYYIEPSFYIPSKVMDAMIYTIASGIIFFLGMKPLFKPHSDHTLAHETTEANIVNFSEDFSKNPFRVLKSQIFDKLTTYTSIRFFAKNISVHKHAANLVDKSEKVDSSLFMLVVTIAVLLIYAILS